MGRLAAVIAVGLLGILVAAPSAAGQAALKQYIPQGNPAGGPGGGRTLASPYPAQGPSGSTKAAIPKPETGSEKGGHLPLTDYPGTPWLWIILAILVAGALARVGLSVVKRRRALGPS